ncbi:hypothetical protein SEMRO_1509_G278490.1 [Seminavis robusta]|uniref:Uncharacterized protein n=1 Tax=Seminavis robusta TaxID=568900 RepID=A0A9N8HVI3_9STRA|nr:hypothetical protein SEMRO_1509_G278490.1 [Seminavis robusta]|eukprot:Sro1509_g278490.1 n/a (186) ;mRNA; f:1281-1838
MTDKLKIASFSVAAGEEMTPLGPEDITALRIKIKGKVAEAVNEGKDIAMAAFIHPNSFVPTGDLLFLEGVEADIIHSDATLLVLRSHQGNHMVSVHFVGGSTPFRIAHVVEAQAEAQADGEEDGDSDGNEEGSNTSPDMLNQSSSDEENADSVGPLPPRNRGARANSSDSSSVEEDFAELSQLHI